MPPPGDLQSSPDGERRMAAGAKQHGQRPKDFRRSAMCAKPAGTKLKSSKQRDAP